MPRQDKVDAVAEYSQLFKDNNAFFVTDYQGLDVEAMTDLRRKLREGGVRYVIGKNTLFRIAAKEASVDGIDEHLVGPTAIAFASEDAAAAAKILHESFKDRELPRTKAFWVEMEAYSPEDIKRLADLPPKEVLYSQVVAAVEAPLTSLVGSLDGFFRKLIGVVDALAEKRKEEGDPGPAGDDAPAAEEAAPAEVEAKADEESPAEPEAKPEEEEKKDDAASE